MTHINFLRARVQKNNLDPSAIDGMLWQAMLAQANHVVDAEGNNSGLTVGEIVEIAAELVLAHLDTSMAS